MRQEFADTAGRLGGQALEHFLEIAIRIMAVELSGLDQAHDHGRWRGLYSSHNKVGN